MTRILAKIDRLSGKKSAYLIVALTVLAYLDGGELVNATELASRGIECICRGLDSIPYTFSFSIDTDTGDNKCGVNPSDSCECYLNGDRVSNLQIPHPDWLSSDETIELDLTCEHLLRAKRSADGSDTETIQETKSNVISRTIKGAGNIVGGIGNAIGSGVDAVGSTIGNTVSGTFHLIGRATKKVTGLANDTIGAVGGVLESSKTKTIKREKEDRKRRAVETESEEEEEAEGEEEVEDQIESSNESTESPEDHSDEDESHGESPASESHEEEGGDHDHEINKRSTDASMNSGDALITTQEDLHVSKESLTAFQEPIKDLLYCIQNITDILNDSNDVAEAKTKMNAVINQTQDSNIKEIYMAYESMLSPALVERETTVTEVAEMVPDNKEGKSFWQQMKSIKDHLAGSKNIYGVIANMESDKNLGEYEKQFVDFFGPRIRADLQCEHESQSIPAGVFDTLSDVASTLKARLKLCPAHDGTETIREIVSLIDSLPTHRQKRAAVEEKSPKKKRKKAKAPKKKGKKTKKSKIQEDAEEESEQACICDPDTNENLE